MQPITGRAVGWSRPANAGLFTVLVRALKDAYESSCAVVAHRVIRSRAFSLVVSQEDIDSRHSRNMIVDAVDGCVLNKSKPRGSPLRLSLVSLVSLVVFCFRERGRRSSMS